MDEHAPEQWPDLAGRIVAASDGAPSHVLPVRVYFEDTDFSGIVYHATYLRWCERGRSDFLRLLGSDHQGLLGGRDGAPSAFVVRRMQIEFLKPARIDDVLEVCTRHVSMSSAVLTLGQTVSRAGKALFEARVDVVLVSLDGRPQRLSQHLRDIFVASE